MRTLCQWLGNDTLEHFEDEWNQHNCLDKVNETLLEYNIEEAISSDKRFHILASMNGPLDLRHISFMFSDITKW